MAIGALLILLVNPIQALWFILFIIVLQQIDGNIIGPKILGNSTGINGFWIMFAILLGGGLFGFIGMLLGALVAPQSETAGSAIGGVIGLAAALIGLTATEKKRSQSGKYAPKLLRVISAADALKN